MSEWLAHIDFAWPWAALLLALPLLTRFLPLPAKTTDERVRVPFLPSLIDALQLDTRPKRGNGASAVLFWLIWSPDAAAVRQQADARHRADPRCLRVNGEK